MRGEKKEHRKKTKYGFENTKLKTTLYPLKAKDS